MQINESGCVEGTKEEWVDKQREAAKQIGFYVKLCYEDLCNVGISVGVTRLSLSPPYFNLILPAVLVLLFDLDFITKFY